jgi:acyl carrier protein
MKRLPDRLQVRQIRPAPAAVAIRSAAELTLNRVVADGIRPSDGVRVLDHLLREGCESHVLVSPYDLTVWSNLLDGDPGANGEAEPANDVRQSVVSQGRPDISTPFVAPAGEVEEALASIWKEALGLAEVGVDDNFFELGGHSLGLIRVIMKCRKAIGMNIPVADPALLENPTIKVMAAFGDDWAKGEPAPQARSIQAVSRERYRVD